MPQLDMISTWRFKPVADFGLKGPSFHTDEFMDGYHTGFNECTEDDSSDSSSTSNKGTFVVKITIIHPENKELKYDEANIHIEEYPEYNIYVGSFSDVFYNDDLVYDSRETYEITMPSGLVDPGEEFDVYRGLE